MSRECAVCTSAPRCLMLSPVSVSIDAFAVDTRALVEVLERPLLQILTELAQRSITNEILFSIDNPEAKLCYHVIAGNVVHPTTHGSRIADRDQLSSDLFLRQSTRDYLEQDNPYPFIFLMRELPKGQGPDFSREVIRGHTR